MKNILLIACFITAAQADPIFQFDAAGGNLTGAPGEIVGWGFTLTDSSGFLLISETAFCPVTATQSDLPADCASAFSSLGNYTDFSAMIPVIGPSPDTSPLTENFDFITNSGYGAFAISPAASAGVTTGEIAIIYDLFTGDPNTDPDATQIGGDNFFALPASISVDAATPEPGTFAIGGLGCAGLIAALRRRKKLILQSSRN